MSFIPTSPLDPAFWFHHCGIDRWWAVWLKKGGGRANPASSLWRNQTFTFPNASGAKVATRAADLLNFAPYDDLASPSFVSETKAAPMAAAGRAQAGTIDATSAGEARNVVIDRNTTKAVRLPGSPGTVVMDDLSGNLHGVIIAVYANLPEGVQPNTEAAAPYQIGSIAPFVHEGSMMDHRHGGPGFQFSIPARIANGSTLVLTLVPDPTSEMSSVIIGSIRLKR
jgi:hypothetical protein